MTTSLIAKARNGRLAAMAALAERKTAASRRVAGSAAQAPIAFHSIRELPVARPSRQELFVEHRLARLAVDAMAQSGGRAGAIAANDRFMPFLPNAVAEKSKGARRQRMAAMYAKRAYNAGKLSLASQPRLPYTPPVAANAAA